jgi:hypothetical protein
MTEARPTKTRGCQLSGAQALELAVRAALQGPPEAGTASGPDQRR